jgi:hypothetical protein
MNRECIRARDWLSAALALLWISGCGADHAGSTTKSNATDTPSAAAGTASSDSGAAPQTDAGDCGAGAFESTYVAIQKVIFDGRGCTNNMCHGAMKMGGLDLRADVSYQNLVEVKSNNSPLFRVMPGVPGESFLYNKLHAATEPGSVEVEGSPMPSGLPPLSADHLEAIHRWIEAGAPRDGSIGGSITGRSDAVAMLLGSCLPAATPIEIKPLEPPAADEGIQFTMAPFALSAMKEVDVCFAQYYDISAVVPSEFQDPDRGVFFVDGQRTRQDPHSHHLGIRHSGLGPEAVNDPSFGKWSCRGPDSHGEACDPLELDACGTGQCASDPQPKSACIGFGPPGNAADIRKGSIATAQTAQYYRAPRDGVYETIPIRGILYMNSHAFNLTNEDTQLHAWINLFYAKDRRDPIQTLAITDHLYIAAGLAPFATKNYCATWTAPQNAYLYTLGSHTHKRGRNFTVDQPDGTRIYMSALYSDPVEKMFDPPLFFDSSDPKQRTLTYCADYNNGLKDDGTPDLDLVTRLSTMPDRTTCKPVACARGKIGAPCNGESDNAACDVTPGDGTGWCDACTITGGQTTENEMFALSPSIVVK